MGHVTYPDGVAIFQLVYYSPCLFSSIYIAWKHGAMKSSGWIFLAIFCLIRIVGSTARIATIVNPDAKTAYTIALITSVLGLSPLLMASLGLIARAYYSLLKQPWATFFSFVVVKIVHIPAVIALILCIVGATNATSPADIDSQSTVHIGIILYTVVLAMLTFLTLVAYLAHRRSERGEGPLILAVSAALPFIFVRLLYSLLAAFSKDPAFNPVTGSTTVSLFMEVLEEMAVVVIYIATGLKLATVAAGAADGAGGTLAYRFGRGDFGTGKLGLLSLGSAAFQAFNRSHDEESQEKASSESHHQRRRRSERHHHGSRPVEHHYEGHRR
ncbi:hypothetical protein LTR36_000015 [Oleoguttula mirabilis]|uniref:DUF7702 domain-containing protein n=1 Tax=Oleoguttula mirabilis TaxID=1507867 RepID=A0AAV9JXM1_9PEZI|nr:hypothetical protein LTR36_000015 [Oleoguttula mirabilis]